MTELKFLTPVIQNIYSNDENVVDRQLKRYSQLITWFKNIFDDDNLHFFSTPGRTELGGNHTDHNNGRVLAASVDIDSIAVVSPNCSNQVTLFSEGYEKAFCIDLGDLNKIENEKGTTSALIRGIAADLKIKGFQIGGFNACITSDVLPGSGLSSSASIEVLIGSIFNVLYNNGNIPAEEIAKIGQYAENEFFRKPCGLMDQLACAVGGIIAIDFKNPIQPEIIKIDFDFVEQKYRLIVVDSGGSHADLTEDYSAIPKEMKAVAKMFKKKSCRELSESTLRANINEIRTKLGDRALLRAMHFIEENERVQKQVYVLQEKRFSDFLKLITESGNSSFKWLQNIYSTRNNNEQGVAVALALTENFISKIGEGACRVHGGGFAGTIQAFLPEKNVDDYTKLMESVFGQKSVKILKIRPYGTIHLNSFKN
jgi:galactokinase